MKVTTTRREIQELGRILDLYRKAIGAKFTYALTKNKNLINSELKELGKLGTSLTKDEKFMEYEEKRMSLCKKFCSKNEKGEPIIVNGQFELSEKRDEFEKAFAELNEEYKDTLNKIDAKRKEIEEYRNKEFEMDLHGVYLKDVPDNIQSYQMDYIKLFIIDSDIPTGTKVETPTGTKENKPVTPLKLINKEESENTH